LLRRLGRLTLPDAPERFVPEAMQRLHVEPIAIGFSTAIAAAGLPLIHRDPFDRIIVVEAQKGKMTVLTKDARFTEYGIPVIG